MRPLVLHLNGVPGIGKSTLARRWADEHPGTWLLDVDALRTWFSGWQTDFVATGAVARPVALAMLTAAAAGGHDVVLPQLLADPVQRDLFRSAAEAGGARWVEVLLVADRAEAGERLAARPDDQPWLRAVRDLVDADPSHVDGYAERLSSSARPDVLVVDTTGLDPDATYEVLVASVDGRRSP